MVWESAWWATYVRVVFVALPTVWIPESFYFSSLRQQRLIAVFGITAGHFSYNLKIKLEIVETVDTLFERKETIEIVRMMVDVRWRNEWNFLVDFKQDLNWNFRWNARTLTPLIDRREQIWNYEWFSIRKCGFASFESVKVTNGHSD